ncbi:WD40 repeat-like protein [Leucogyrophana mollusca]|uniref:WD40 repeat-like protein n=1 Tax=Leucogyrophana mollusca TaxID=85980 RepID=A0ACB8B2Q2_9AGAM|nr:WD40 repeat-like protein [Leucogyrophana mollusca]
MPDGTYLPLQTFKDGHVDSVVCLAFSRGGKHLASGGEDGNIIIWDVVEGHQLSRIHMKTPILSLQWDFALGLFCGFQDGALLLIPDVVNVNSTFEVLTGVKAPVYCMDLHSSSRELAIGLGCEVHVAKEMTKATYATFTVLPEPTALPSRNPDADSNTNDDIRVRARAVYFFKNSRKLVVAYLNHGIVCWDVSTRSQVWVIVPTHRHQHICENISISSSGHAALSPDRRYVLVSNLNNGLDLYPIGKSNVLQAYRYPAHADKNFPFTVDFLQDGDAVVCGSPSGKVAVWNTKTGVHVQTLSHGGLKCYCGTGCRIDIYCQGSWSKQLL